jgi:hypothetical protein
VFHMIGLYSETTLQSLLLQRRKKPKIINGHSHTKDHNASKVAPGLLTPNDQDIMSLVNQSYHNINKIRSSTINSRMSNTSFFKRAIIEE